VMITSFTVSAGASAASAAMGSTVDAANVVVKSSDRSDTASPPS
jgi:hypothetical protein